MEIFVQGKSKAFFTPDEVVLSICFFTKAKTYEEALHEGVANVQTFIDNVLFSHDFKKEDMKTRSFVIQEEKQYNESTRAYELVGYSFRQMASLKFDYDKNLMASIMVSTANLENAPKIQINFGIKNEEEYRKMLLTQAYRDAEKQALIIAQASSKTLKTCQKVDFQPLDTAYLSRSMMGSDIMYAKAMDNQVEENIINTFTPEDIELSETLYCLWIAE